MKNGFIEKITTIVLPEFWNTFYMVIITLIISTIIGFLIAIILYVTDRNGLRPNKTINSILNFIVNTIRSFPFIILIVAIIPLTRLIVGTSIGKNAAVVPMTITATTYVARLVESNLKEVDYSLIEAGKSFGATNFQIIKDIVIIESLPSIVSTLTYVTVSILSLSAMAGTVGAGGLGAIARTYGYQNFNYDIMYGTVILLIIIVQIIQIIGKNIYNLVK